MHSATINSLQGFKDEAQNDGNPRVFLERLSPLHVNWHNQPSASRRIGFLIFHWHVVAHFKELGLVDNMGVNPIYTVAVFSPGGAYSEADFNDAMTGVSASQSLQGLADFSRAIEGWHNEAHMVIADKTGNPLMDPGRNVFYRRFWRLHLFIDQRFESEMTSYAQAAHPQLTTSAQVIDHLENSHHGWVGLI